MISGVYFINIISLNKDNRTAVITEWKNKKLSFLKSSKLQKRKFFVEIFMIAKYMDIYKDRCAVDSFEESSLKEKLMSLSYKQNWMCISEFDRCNLWILSSLKQRNMTYHESWKIKLRPYYRVSAKGHRVAIAILYFIA